MTTDFDSKKILLTANTLKFDYQTWYISIPNLMAYNFCFQIFFVGPTVNNLLGISETVDLTTFW